MPRGVCRERGPQVRRYDARRSKSLVFFIFIFIFIFTHFHKISSVNSAVALENFQKRAGARILLTNEKAEVIAGSNREIVGAPQTIGVGRSKKHVVPIKR